MNFDFDKILKDILETTMLTLFGEKIIEDTGIVILSLKLILKRRNTITSQYNFVQIVVYPIKFNLCKVVVNKKDTVKKDLSFYLIK